MLSSVVLIIGLQAFAYGAAAEGADRQDAFIGYSERSECNDHIHDCHGKAQRNGCLKDPYNMRLFCPISCNVPKCVHPGTLKAKHRGFANAKDTVVYARRWAQHTKLDARPSEVVNENSRHFRQYKFLGESLKLSSLGSGTYLGELDSRTDDRVTSALVYAVVNGWNVIDTASTYRWGRAESSVGDALDALLAGASTSEFLQEAAYASDITRGMVFVSSKAGFVEEPLVKQLVQAGRMTRADVVQGHTLAPAYLAASVNQSLHRMNLETLDLLYLHNPAEMQLQAIGRGPFMARLKEAFAALEAMRSTGQLRSYGLATWDCFRVPPGHPGHLALEEVVALAREAAGGKQSGFTAIQLPVSAGMQEAVTQPWQSLRNASTTLLRAAQDLGVAVFTSGPLGEGDLLKRLSGGPLDPVPELRGQEAAAAKLLQLARSAPGVLTALVGQKAREHVVANLGLARQEPLEEKDFTAAAAAVAAILKGP